jgi:prepilin-type processing-associated H-X9-DG protein
MFFNFTNGSEATNWLAGTAPHMKGTNMLMLDGRVDYMTSKQVADWVPTSTTLCYPFDAPTNNAYTPGS